ncbi:MAG: M3 family oligoendopeptidase [Anaerolineae bacterium]|nr:M3 family oligoendopeptidase [Anaerolineae bacterium]
MTNHLPASTEMAFDWDADHYTPFYTELLNTDLTEANVHNWLADWSRIADFAGEVASKLYVATTVDTTDEVADKRFKKLLNEIYPVLLTSEDMLKRKLLASGLNVPELAIPMRNIRADVELFREENLSLISQEGELGMEYDKIIGAQTINWDGAEITLPQVQLTLKETDRARREQIWRLAEERRLADKEALDGLWRKFMGLRKEMSANAGMSDYRAYQWKLKHRFDYTADDAIAFNKAVEEVVVPVAARLYERRRKRLGVDSLRPWDTLVDPDNHPALKPYDTVEELENTMATLFDRVDPQLGAYYHTMINEKLLDLDNRKGKAPGGYCTYYPNVKRPFIFMNAVGVHDDVQTLLHEGGHAFHAFESANLPYAQQKDVPMEFAEVASMSMELIGAPYLNKANGGFYVDADANRARVEHLEGMIQFWGYMSVVDMFQHWIYTNHDHATDPAACDEKWMELWSRYMVGIDFSGLEAYLGNRWRRQLHIFQLPFYYIEYGLAQLGAAQVWANSLNNQAGALADYRKALALGGTVKLPDLFQTAGAKLSFDSQTLADSVNLIERTIYQLDPA